MMKSHRIELEEALARWDDLLARADAGETIVILIDGVPKGRLVPPQPPERNPGHGPYQALGFTLIELSIVLVIIGLIVGGVLVGRDLIRAAELRATMSQIENYNTSVMAFRMKYNGLPGDLARATQFGMEPRSGAFGHGNGDGILQACGYDVGTTPMYGAMRVGCEIVLFWRDLSFANLVDGSFTTATDAYTQINAGQAGTYFPRAKIGGQAFVTVLAWYIGTDIPHGNYFAIGQINTSNATGFYTSVNEAFTPIDGLSIDTKMDDGLAATGAVWVSNEATGFESAVLSGCLAFNAGQIVYDVSSSGANDRLCNLHFLVR